MSDNQDGEQTGEIWPPRGDEDRDQQQAELEAAAADPRTDWETLHWIAENYAGLRPAVAANPGTYQELVDALAQLGDPEIDAAIARRPRGKEVSSAAAAVSPMAGMWDTATHAIPAYQEPEQPEQAEAPAEPAEPHEPLPVDRQMDEAAPDDRPDDRAEDPETYEPEPYQPEPYAPATYEPEPYRPEPYESEAYAPASYARASNAGHDPHRPQDEEPAHRSPLPLIAAVVLAVVGVGAIVALIAVFLTGDGDEPVAEPQPAPATTEDEPAADEETGAAQEETDPEQGAEESPAAEDTASEDTAVELEAARAAVVDLPEESSCTADDDADVVAGLLSSAAAAEDGISGEDTDLLQDTFSQLQSECSATHAAGVYEAARSGEQAPEDDGGQALDEVGSDWVNRAMGLNSAEEMDSFELHGGNIQCEFDDGVRCTVYDHNYSAPDGCSDGTTYRMQVDAGTPGTDCANPVEETNRDSLSTGQAATDGFLVCMNISSRVSCYNSVDGNGFELSETGHYALEY